MKRAPRLLSSLRRRWHGSEAAVATRIPDPTFSLGQYRSPAESGVAKDVINDMARMIKHTETVVMHLSPSKYVNSLLSMYSSTHEGLLKVDKANSEEGARRIVKDVTTRHGLGTVDWLLDHVHAVGYTSSVDEILTNHFTITLLGEIFDKRMKGGEAVVRVGSSGIHDLLKEVVDETSFLTAVAYPDDDVEVVVEGGVDGVEEKVDLFVVPSSFRYIMMEGTKNAISSSHKLSKDGGEFKPPNISLHCNDGEFLEVRVRDWGVGLNDIDVDKIFQFGQKKEKFDRLDFQTSYAALPHDPMEGVGVGLALSRILARRDGGDVELRRPEDGGGAEFFLRMPLVNEGKKHAMFLHIAPCGDAWVSPELFAAKHLNNDYVRSFGPIDEESLDVDEMEIEVLQSIYDKGGEKVTAWETVNGK